MSQPTGQQKKAIESAGAVLLAAGAGTGKTATLVSRCVRLVTDAEVDVDALLVVTFTNAAAAEMKQRLREALQTESAIASGEKLERLQRQLLLLAGAHISTIHAFCLELIRAHFAELQLDPGLAVLEESVSKPLEKEIVREVVLQSIASDAATQSLAENYCGGDGAKLGDLIRNAHHFFVKQPQAERRLAEELEKFSNPSPAVWLEKRGEILRCWLLDWQQPLAWQTTQTLAALSQKLSESSGKGKTADGIRNIQKKLPELAKRVAQLTAKNPAEDFAAAIRHALKLGGGDFWVRGTGMTRGLLEDFFAEAAELTVWLPNENGDAVADEWNLIRQPMCKLLELTQTFAGKFTEAKHARGGVDFSDLEQLALRLLVDKNGAATAIAKEWQERFEHVFVDECQDINAAQDALVRAVSRVGARANLFMVGDVKQSIYRFRMAAPELFRGYAREWEGRAHHQVLALTENFRSRAGILAVVNDLFGCLMSPRLGDVGYGETDRLQFGVPKSGDRSALSLNPSADKIPKGAWRETDCRVELHLINKKSDASETGADENSGGGGWDDLLEVEQQARVAAVRLRELMDGRHEVWDKRENRFREMKWSDVGLLLRAVSGRAGAFLREFRRREIPLVAEQGDFLETLEASDLVALLRVLDNPRQDIPLFAVLRSPLAGFSLDELVELRPPDKKSGAWPQLEKIANETSAIAVKAKTFLAQLNRWRRLALMTSLSCVIETALAETRYEAFLLTLPDGTDRVANVRRFLDLARRYDPLQRQGLHRFIKFIDEQQEAEQEIEPLPPRQPDAVQLLSIHKSKGLEFPVVVLAGIGSRFHQPELNEAVLFSRRWGFAPTAVDFQQQKRQDTLLRWQVRREENREAVAEELRLLYVAVTRARDTLLLVGGFNPEGKAWQERAALPPSVGVALGKSYCDWIGLWLHQRADWTEKQGEVIFSDDEKSARLRWKIYSGSEDVLASAATENVITPKCPPLSESKLAGFQWNYPQQQATTISAKTSASALRRMAAEIDEDAAAPWANHRAFHAEISNGGLTATQIGTAHHAFFQHVDLKRTGSEAELRVEAERLRVASLLADAETKALDIAAILRFWQSAVGIAIREQHANVRRELAFTAAFSPAEIARLTGSSPAGTADDFVVVQGAVDLAVLLPQEIWIVDFKTDHISAAELAGRSEEYKNQLWLYAVALERIYHRPVKRRTLHFLALGQSVEMPHQPI